MKHEGRSVWVLRHGLREDSDPIRWCDKVKDLPDPDLLPLGVEMMKRSAGRLEGEKIDHILASPFLRTVRSAACLADQLDRPIKIEYGFHELLDPSHYPYGLPRLPTPAQRAEAFPQIDLSYASAFYPDYSELNNAGTGFTKRVFGALESALRTLDGNILIMTHYAVCNILKHHFTGSFMDGYIELSAIFQYTMREGKWQPDRLCDAAHVKPLYPTQNAVPA